MYNPLRTLIGLRLSSQQMEDTAQRFIKLCREGKVEMAVRVDGRPTKEQLIRIERRLLRECDFQTLLSAVRVEEGGYAIFTNDIRFVNDRI